MESNHEPASTGSSKPTRPPWGDPSLHDLFHRTKPQVEAWCETRPEVSSLAGLDDVYGELRLVDAERNHLWTRPADHDSNMNEAAAGNGSKPPRPWRGVLGRKDPNPRDFPQEPDLEGTQWYHAIVDLFDARVRALRSRAMQLSRGGIRPLKITDLPFDILRCIFEYFRDDPLLSGDRAVCWDDYEYSEPDVPRWGQRRDLKSARLACRLFCDLASPHLLSVVELELSPSSLDMLDGISRAPRIAAGVRAIRLWLADRSEDLADDIRMFRDACLQRLEETESNLKYDLRRWREDRQNRPERDRAEQHRGLRVEEAAAAMARLRREWTLYPEHPDGEMTLSEYQKLLLQAHHEFRRMHQEQRRLLEDGSFARSVASAVARMGNVRSFRLTSETPDRHKRAFFRGRARRRVVRDTDTLIRFLASPFSWSGYCAKLLWELPIALHRAGASLTDLSLNYLPLSQNAPMLCPRSPDTPGDAVWDELSAACEQLEILHVVDDSYEDLPEEAKPYVDKYLASVLARCGGRLRRLHLNFRLPLDDAIEFKWYYAGPVIGALQGFPRAQVLLLKGVQLRQAQLEALCDKLGHGNLTRLHLADIRLQSGSWVGAVEILRQKVALAETKAPGELDVSVRKLFGGEFSTVVSDSWVEKREADMRRWMLIRETERYTKGQREDNPLRKREIQSRLRTPVSG